jgi:hypothetical protein
MEDPAWLELLDCPPVGEWALSNSAGFCHEDGDGVILRNVGLCLC